MDHHWQKPPVWSTAVGVLLLALGVTTGGSLVFQDQFYAFATPIVRGRPVVHNLTGIPALDEAKITETVEQSNRSFRMLHVHGLGVGLLILVASPDPCGRLEMGRGSRQGFVSCSTSRSARFWMPSNGRGTGRRWSASSLASSLITCSRPSRSTSRSRIAPPIFG